MILLWNAFKHGPIERDAVRGQMQIARTIPRVSRAISVQLQRGVTAFGFAILHGVASVVDGDRRLDAVQRQGNLRMIHVTAFDLADYFNCLLYTSPSPRDGLLSRMPSSA